MGDVVDDGDGNVHTSGHRTLFCSRLGREFPVMIPGRRPLASRIFLSRPRYGEYPKVDENLERGNALLQQGKLADAAIREFKLALQIDPSHVKAAAELLKLGEAW